MSTPFTGVKVIETTNDNINKLYVDRYIELETVEYPNLYLVIKASEQQSALARVDSTGTKAVLLPDKLTAQGIKPKNKEQVMALDALLDVGLTVNIMTGLAGSGKTLLSLAAALQHIEKGNYKKLILTRPMSQVGQYDLGILPGNVDEKFLPFLGNFETNLSQLGGKDIDLLMQRYDIECLPIQLMRGCSFKDAIIICDEIQILDAHEMLTIGTRVGENCKIVLLGDLNQRDKKIAKEKTGLYTVMNSELAKESCLVSAIQLLKNERSVTAKLFSDIFESE